MSTAVLDEPIVQEPTHQVADAAEEKRPISARVQDKLEPHPLFIVFVACVVAFHLAAAMIGSVAAWIYYLRDSGAFTP